MQDIPLEQNIPAAWYGAEMAGHGASARRIRQAAESPIEIFKIDHDS